MLKQVQHDGWAVLDCFVAKAPRNDDVGSVIARRESAAIQ
jgi:hypothetical protein